ncbi:lysophospholipid acyltransferase family protein [Pseudolysinimonas sp.]|uniref:lysophospholipid acyltransferase family protein n=1 Tax=Pseudolysinimonas sp. TaxID=2680009 RepID=UPI003784AD0A
MRRRKPEKLIRWRIVAAVAIPIFEFFGRYRMRGLDHIPKRGAFVIAPNHVTNFDPLTTAYLVWRGGRVPRFLAKASVFRVPLLGALLRYTGQIPVERSGGGPDPLAAAGRLIDEELAVIVYPEGTLTRDPDEWPMRGKTGAVRLALQYGIPLIPMAHWGVQKILPRYGGTLRFFPRSDVEMLVGPPLDLTPWAGRTDAAALAAATTALMDAIAVLLGELRGQTPPAERWDPVAHGQSEYGRFEPPTR